MTMLRTVVLAGLFIASVGAVAGAQDEAIDPDTLGQAGVVVVANPAPPTRLEGLLFRKGSVILKGYTEIGTVRGEDDSAVRILAVELADQTRQEKEYGLAIEVRQAAGRTTVSYVDYDEADALSAAIATMVKLDRNAMPFADFSAQYRSKGNLEVSNYDNNGARMAAVRSIQILPVTGQVIWATARFRIPVLAQLQEQVAAGKGAVDQAKGKP